MAGSRDIRAGRAFVELYVRDKLSAALRGASARLKSFGHALMGVGKTMTMIRNAALIPAAWSIKLAADAETISTSFRTLVGDAELADKTLRELRRFGAETPFEFPELAKASTSLIAFGVSAENLLPTLRTIGDLSAGLNIPIGELAEIYGKARTQGRLFMEDINQLTGRGIPIIQELAKQFNVAESEVRKLVEQGKVGFPSLQRAFQDMTGEGGKFQGMMKVLSGTFSGLFSTMQDNIKEAVTAFGKLLIEGFDLKGMLERVTEVVQKFTEWMKNNRDTVLQFARGILAIGTAGGVVMGVGAVFVGLATAIGAAAGVASGLATAFSLVASALGAILTPAGLVGVAISVTLMAAIVGAIRESERFFTTFAEGFHQMADTAKTSFGGIVDAIAVGDLQAAWGVALQGMKVAWFDMLHTLLKAYGEFAMGAADMLVERFKVSIGDIRTMLLAPFLAAKALATAPIKAGEMYGKALQNIHDFASDLPARADREREKLEAMRRDLGRRRAEEGTEIPADLSFFRRDPTRMFSGNVLDSAAAMFEGRDLATPAVAGDTAPAAPAAPAHDPVAMRRNRSAPVKAPAAPETDHERRVRIAKEKLAAIEEARKQRVVDAAMGLPVQSIGGGPRGTFSAAGALAMFGVGGGPLDKLLAAAEAGNGISRDGNLLLQAIRDGVRLEFS